MAERITPEFTQMVTEFVSVSEQLTEITKQTKGLRDTKKSLEEQIKNYMIDHELFNLDLQGAGTLSVTTKKVVKKASKQEIQDTLLETIEEEDHRDIIISKIFPIEAEEVTKLQRKKGAKN